MLGALGRVQRVDMHYLATGFDIDVVLPADFATFNWPVCRASILLRSSENWRTRDAV